MEIKMKNRPADNHPAVQNLRCFFKEYQQNGSCSTLASFAAKFGMNPKAMGRYLRGEVLPRRNKIEFWAKLFDVDVDYMMNVSFAYIPYPFEKESKPKKPGKHITLKEVRHRYDEMTQGVINLLGEDDIIYNGNAIVDFIKSQRF